jgi:hypothetical protein
MMDASETAIPQRAIADPGRRRVLWTIAALTAAILIVPASWLAYGACALAALLLVLYGSICVLEGRVGTLLLFWVLISPLGYYFLSFPRERPFCTFDRGFILLLGLAACFAPGATSLRTPEPLRRAGVVWGVFLLTAGLSLLKISGGLPLLSGVRVWLDGFLLPALLAWCVISCVRVREQLKVLHLLICVVVVGLAAIGFAEAITGQDILAIPGAGLYFAGSGESQFLRVNGPFSSNNSFGLIGLVLFCFLLFLRQTEMTLPRWQRVLHWIGVGSALLVSLMPLFRSIFLTLLLIALLDIWFTHNLRKRIFRVVTLLVLGVIFLLGNAVLPDFYQERVSSGENVYARMAQQRQTFQLFLRNPLLGVGLNNFIAAVPRETPYMGLYSGVDPLDAPHSNLGAVLAETGILGFIPYVLANGLLVAAFWTARRRGSPGFVLVWKYFLYIFLSYWVSGLSLTSGHYGDLNLWYLLTLAILFKYGATDPSDVSSPTLCFRQQSLL